jgi:Peptidase A4 family
VIVGRPLPARLAAGLAAGLTATVALALAGAPAALADTSQSSNWAGYAIHRTGVEFTQVVGEWIQPTPACTAGERTYSSDWVGLGGYSISSQALEQIGTELDCNRRGQAVSSAWYEMVPAASRTVRLTIHSGDRVRATVAVSGHEVQLTLEDLTRHKSFTKLVRASVLDTSSADWIVEAPALCLDGNSCQTLPLADFGSATFSLASAESTTGHTGTIADRRWDVSRIRLAEAGRRFVGGPGPAGASPSATPSALSARGSSFTVAYSGLTAGTPPASVSASRVTAVRAGQLVPAGRLVRPVRR